MDDFISRQAAIDAVCKACSMVEDYHKCDGYPETSTWCDELVALRALPSAQPEIIRCRECKFASGDSRICMKFGHSPIGELDFCAWAERKTDE